MKKNPLTLKKNFSTLLIVVVLLACIIVGVVEFNMIYLISNWDWSAMIKAHTTTTTTSAQHPSIFVVGAMACALALVVGIILCLVCPPCKVAIKKFMNMDY